MRRLIILLLWLCIGHTIQAQDLIHKRDKSTIEARVLEISTDEITYKRFSNPDGPTYRIPIGQILYIEYPNGECDTFAEEVIPQTPSQAEAAPETAQAPQPETVRAYQVGDLYDVGEVRGVVIATTNGGIHGLILSLEQELGRWDTFEKEEMCTVGASAEHDGSLNMEAVARYIAQNNLTWEHFPAFQWCRALGEGWYLPSIDEWLTISFNFNGGSRTQYNREARNRVNDTLKKAGGKRLDKMLYYYSSTEQNEKMALTSHMAMEPPYVLPLKKNGLTYLVRAVHKF